MLRTSSQVPLAMDALGQHIVLATAPLEISLMRVALHGSLTATGNPIAHLTVVRELSILSIGTPLRVRPSLCTDSLASQTLPMFYL